MTEEWFKREFRIWASSIMNPITHMTVWEMLQKKDQEKKDIIDDIIKWAEKENFIVPLPCIGSAISVIKFKELKKYLESKKG